MCRTVANDVSVCFTAWQGELGMSGIETDIGHAGSAETCTHVRKLYSGVRSERPVLSRAILKKDCRQGMKFSFVTRFVSRPVKVVAKGRFLCLELFVDLVGVVFADMLFGIVVFASRIAVIERQIL